MVLSLNQMAFDLLHDIVGSARKCQLNLMEGLGMVGDVKESGCGRGSLSPLSQRELEVLRWLKMGKSSWDISRILTISERTVNYHVGNIIRKLGVVNRLQAVFEAVRMNLIDSE